MGECHGSSEAVIEILHLALLSGKLKINVGDFRILFFKMRATQSVKVSVTLCFSISFKEEMWSSGAVHKPPEIRTEPEKKKKN